MSHSPDTVTLYVLCAPLEGRLDLGLVKREAAGFSPAWIAVEPRASLPVLDGRVHRGRIPGLEPLCQSLPEGLDDLPLLAASLYANERWRHLHDAHPASGVSGFSVTWSLTSFEGARAIEGLETRRQSVLTWQDRDRFGLGASNLPQRMEVDHFFHAGKRLAWRIVGNITGDCK